MRVFVAYGYRDRNLWIPRLIYPLIRAFGDEVMNGEEMPGEIITEGVRQRINRSDALIGFVTRLEDIGNGRSTTHRWVTDELASAHGQGKLIVEVREVGVDEQRGIIGDRQPVVYDEGRRDECIVEIVRALGERHRTNNLTLQLLPEECARQIMPLLKHPRIQCSYKVLDGIEEGEEVRTKILPITGGLFVNARNVPRQALIQLNIECAGQSWSSDFESTDSLGIRLRQD